MISEQIHRYSRWITWPFELLTGLGVLAACLLFGRDLLRYMWFLHGGADAALFRRLPFLSDLYIAVYGVRGTNRDLITSALQLWPALAWLALALFVALMLRNAFPTVRTSPRGMLIEFAGGWLPVPWESLQAIKVTEDLASERFVLLAVTSQGYLTGWHRFYNFLYRFGFRRGFLIISAISDFDGLIKTLLSESDRVARVLDNVQPARLQEGASSPLFRFLLGPASFFSRRSKAEMAVPMVAASVGGPVVHGTYPARISRLLSWSAVLLLVLLVLRYINYWMKFLLLMFPRALVTLPLFRDMQSDADLLAIRNMPFWLLVAAHLMFVLVFGIIVSLRNLLPELETRPNGLAVRYFRNWYVIPWSRITAIKVTELTEESQIVLVQTGGGLPYFSRLSSLIYHGHLTPGVLITSAMNSFEPLLQRVVLEISRLHSGEGVESDQPIFQNEARSPMLMLSLRAGPTLDQMVADIREDEENKSLQVMQLLRAARPMFWLSLPPTLLILFDRVIHRAIMPDFGVLSGMLILFLLSFLEWPLVSLVSVILEDITGGGEEGNRAFYLYPMTQLPRLVLLIGALVAVLLGIPFLPILLWLGAIVWSFLLSAGLWEALYDWRGGQLLAGGLISVIFQLLILLAYLLVFS